MKLEDIINNTKSVLALSIAIPTGLFCYMNDDKTANMVFLNREIREPQLRDRLVQDLRDYQETRGSPIDYIKSWYHNINDMLNPKQEIEKYFKLAGLERKKDNQRLRT
ncbi:hypothetical protein HN385_01035 [archaeon]|jgi:hypothetical protein|nr:hypothetical protein [archaeon]MBT3450607.1 hypothetical protein [archaeon]MBT6868707.1 hypothetical protein [archaeon]MBT7193495.1 hypothetical protein [archaeon]MBT7381086.1 hypothetical protein [archaeon]